MEHVAVDDRISGLPEPILHHILSFLLTEDAVKIAPSCKRLNQVWNTLPYLDLDRDIFPQSTADGGLTTDIAIKRRREKLFTFVEQTLSSRRMQDLTLHKFRLVWIKFDVELRKNLDRWIDYLVHCNINELVLLGRRCEEEEERYKLPSILLTAASLRVLSLSHCSLPLGSFTFRALQKLSLEHVCLHEKLLLDIISTCPLLEDLVLCCVSGLQRRISLAPPRHSRLRNLVLMPSFDEEVDEVVIEAHNLEKLSYAGTHRRTTINIITKTDASLKCLYLSGVHITNTWFCELISRLSCLEELLLSQLNLKAIEISSSSLKRLTLSRVFHYGHIRFGEFKIDTPSLVSLVYIGTLSSVFQNSLAVKNVCIRLDELNYYWRSEHLCTDLVQFLQKFDHSEVVTLECTKFELIIFPPEMRLNLHAPLAHIKHLILGGVFRGAPIDVLAELFEGVRWFAPNLDSLSLKRNIISEGDRIELIKFTAGQCDCSTSPSECLKKCRSRTKFEVEGVGVEVGALSNYLHRGDGSRGDYSWDLQYSME